MTVPKDEFGDLYRSISTPMSLGIPVIKAATVVVDRAEYERMKATLLEQNTLLKRIGSQPQCVAVVLAVRDERTYISGPNGPLMVQSSPKASEGQLVLIDSGTNAIIDTVPQGDLPPSGLVGTIDRCGAGWSVRLEHGDRAVIVPERIAKGLTSGDRVVVSLEGGIVLANLGKTDARHVVDYEPLLWDEIGGCAEAKKALRMALEYPVTHAALYAGYGKRPCRGALLYGAPGTGKTMLARAAATAVAGTGPDAFLYVKGPELRSKWQGETEANIRRLFDRARAHKKATGRPAVIAIDEADALLGRRDTGGLASTDSAVVVPQFLVEMDGLQGSSAFVLLLTNYAEALDPAVTRDGRIDRKILVPRPDRDATAQIFGLRLRDVPGGTPELINETLQVIYSDELVVARANSPVGEIVLHLRDLLGGAVIAGIVDKATDHAIERDLHAGTPSGLSIADMRHGMFLSARELATVNLHHEFHAKLHSQQIEGN